MINWTNVKDGLPEHDGTCIVWFEDTSTVFLGWYRKNRWTTKRRGFEKTTKVTHWSIMNIPPY